MVWYGMVVCIVVWLLSQCCMAMLALSQLICDYMSLFVFSAATCPLIIIFVIAGFIRQKEKIKRPVFSPHLYPAFYLNPRLRLQAFYQMMFGSCVHPPLEVSVFDFSVPTLGLFCVYVRTAQN